MSIDIKLSGQLYRQIILDLVRPHPFASERVGFSFGRMSSSGSDGKIVLLNRYHSLPDHQYVEDPSVGARIGSDAMAWAMQAVYQGRASKEGIFHVHLHPHLGETGMSTTDSRELPRLIPGFQSVGREAPHGIIIFSRNHGTGWVWVPGATVPVLAGKISVIGNPIAVFTRRGAK